MTIEIKTETGPVDWEKVSALLEKAGMSRSEPEICRRAFEASQVSLFAYSDGELVGVSRALSDRVKQAAVYDVAVLPEFQGNGIGRRMMEAIFRSLPGVSIILYASPGKEPFYQKLGFRRMKTGMARFVREEEMTSRGFTE